MSTNDGSSPSSNFQRLIFSLTKYLTKKFSDEQIENLIVELIKTHQERIENFSILERDIIMNFLKSYEIMAEDIMIPRPDIIAVEKKATEIQLKKIIAESEYTRLPVFDGEFDKIIGFINVKDALNDMIKGKKLSITSLIYPILIIPESMNALDLLAKMKTSRIHMSIVVDEYGGVRGLVTLENVLESLVGEIQDESDGDEDQLYREIDENTIEAHGRLPIIELEKIFRVDLKEENEEVNTVSGLVVNILGKLPKKGQTATHESGLNFKVTSVDQRKINKVIVTKIIAEEEID